MTRFDDCITSSVSRKLSAELVADCRLNLLCSGSSMHITHCSECPKLFFNSNAFDFEFINSLDSGRAQQSYETKQRNEKKTHLKNVSVWFNYVLFL